MRLNFSVRCGSSGVVMVEVLCVVLMVSVGLTAVMRALSQAAAGTSLAMDYSRAALLAENMLERARIDLALSGTLPDVKALCGESAGEPECRLELFPPVKPDSAGGSEKAAEIFSRMKECQAEVVFNRGGKRRQVIVSVLLPATGGAAE